MYTHFTCWNNLNSRFILLKERGSLYKYLHEILPTKKSFKEIRSIASSVCDYCTQEECNSHLVYKCERYKEVVTWFKGVLQKYTDIYDPQLNKLSFLETPKLNHKSKNAKIMLLSTHIFCIWYARQFQTHQYACLKYIKRKYATEAKVNRIFPRR